MGLMSVGGGGSIIGMIAVFFQWEKYTTRGDYSPGIFESGIIQSGQKYTLIVAKNCTLQFHFLRNDADGFWLKYRINTNSYVKISEGTTVSLKKGDEFIIGYDHQDSDFHDSYFMITAKTVKA